MVSAKTVINLIDLQQQLTQDSKISNEIESEVKRKIWINTKQTWLANSCSIFYVKHNLSYTSIKFVEFEWNLALKIAQNLPN